MRIDHFAYQRATQVAGLGFLLQAAIWLTLLLFGLISSDTAFTFASYYMALGLIVWLSLIIVFHQHKLERLEALEEDELAATRGGAGSAFDSEPNLGVAARRLDLMHKWLMPIVSLVLAGMLGFIGWRQISFMLQLDEVEELATEFTNTPHMGWAIAICVGFAVASFIFSRFVSGMSRSEAWQNLRGGAGYMVGNALVLLAVAVGICFRYFDNDRVIETVAWAIAIFQIVVAAEIVLNFILNLYRPRIPGEVPRPAFDSRVLSHLAAPDSIVRSVNEAVNYQFGFDVTSSWGYQLLLRSFAWLLALGILVLFGLSTMVIVEPHQQAIRLRGGALISEEPANSGIMWKLPWPIETAEVYDVTRVRDLPLTARRTDNADVRLWSDELDAVTDGEVQPFLVARSETRGSRFGSAGLMIPSAVGAITEAVASGTGTDDAPPGAALVDAEIVLQYRIRRDEGLLKFLDFSDELQRRQRIDSREQVMKSLALQVVTQQLAQSSLDDVLSFRRDQLATQLRESIQSKFDDPKHDLGVEVLAVNLSMIRPIGDAAAAFEELGISDQARLENLAVQRSLSDRTTATVIRDFTRAPEVLAEIETWERLRDEAGSSVNWTDEQREAIEAQRIRVEMLLAEIGGGAIQGIEQAESDKWVTIMEARAKASQVRGQSRAYHAAPELYRQRQIMRVFSNSLGTLRKYVIGVTPEQLNLDFELKEPAPLLDFVATDQDQGTTNQ